MSRIKWAIRLLSIAMASAILVGLTLEPRMIARRWDDALFASWRALGDRLAGRQLDAIARQLDREREDAGRIATLRDDLDARLRSLVARRAMATERADEPGSSRGDGPGRELGQIDSAIALLESAVARADAALFEARRDLREREAEQLALEASADASRMDRQLDEAAGDRSSWSARLARARDVLRTTHPAAAERVGRPDGP